MRRHFLSCVVVAWKEIFQMNRNWKLRSPLKYKKLKFRIWQLGYRSLIWWRAEGHVLFPVSFRTSHWNLSESSYTSPLQITRSLLSLASSPYPASQPKLLFLKCEFTPWVKAPAAAAATCGKSLSRKAGRRCSSRASWNPPGTSPRWTGAPAMGLPTLTSCRPRADRTGTRITEQTGRGCQTWMIWKRQPCSCTPGDKPVEVEISIGEQWWFWWW